jgi:hypothetical protein
MGTMWQKFSNEITQVVNEAGKSIVAIDGRSGHTSRIKQQSRLALDPSEAQL